MPAMSERIEWLFARCREEKRAAFIPYICAGDPRFARSVEIALALEEDPNDSRGNKNENLLRIRLIAPTTPAARIAAIAAAARGFIYYVSREGVTGARDSIAESLKQKLTIIRQRTRLPIAVGFGIS